MLLVFVDLFRSCLMGEIIIAISTVMNNARAERSFAESMNRARLSFISTTFWNCVNKLPENNFRVIKMNYFSYRINAARISIYHSRVITIIFNLFTRECGHNAIVNMPIPDPTNLLET